MTELRKDPVIGRWVIIAEERSKRPHDFRTQSVPPPGGFCPFCGGNESKTPPEIFAFRDPGSHRDGPGWRVRVVPNKFPVLRVEGGLDKRAYGMYDRISGLGAHEVFIETPEHRTSLTALSEERVGEVLTAYRERILDLSRDRRLAYGLLFKNVGATAGASLEHTHSQLIVTPIVPARVTEEITGARRHFDWHGRCVFCDMIVQELSMEERVVMASDRFVAFAPYASRFPFETWILPRDHVSHYDRIRPEDVADLAVVLKRVLRRIEIALDSPPYNYVVHTGPMGGPSLDHYHWHVEIMPRVTRTAGFEWGTGFYVNPVPPESAAEYLRQMPDE